MTQYHPYCLDCDSSHHYDNDCSDASALQEVCRQAAALAVFGDLLKAIGSHSADYNSDPVVYLNDNRNAYRIDFDWFAKHAGHRIRVRNEYLHVLEECGARFGCDHCGSQSRRCRRLWLHDGDHAEERDK